MAPGNEGLGWAVGVGGSDREVGQDLLDARGLLNGRTLIAEPESQCIAKVTKVATSRLTTSQTRTGNTSKFRLSTGCTYGLTET